MSRRRRARRLGQRVAAAARRCQVAPAEWTQMTRTDRKRAKRRNR